MHVVRVKAFSCKYYALCHVLTESRPMRILEQWGVVTNRDVFLFSKSSLLKCLKPRHVTNQDVLLYVTILLIFILIVFAMWPKCQKIFGSLTVVEVKCWHFATKQSDNCAICFAKLDKHKLTLKPFKTLKRNTKKNWPLVFCYGFSTTWTIVYKNSSFCNTSMYDWVM